MPIVLQRIYEHTQSDGYRVLVDRVWPRGISKVTANLDDWAKDITPSPTLSSIMNRKNLINLKRNIKKNYLKINQR